MSTQIFVKAERQMLKILNLVVLITLLGFAILCYSTTIPTYFLSDDFWVIGRVARHGMFSTWGVFPIILRPGTVFSFLVDHYFWGFNPIGYHLTNILFHGLSSFAVFLIARHVFIIARLKEVTIASFMASFLFLTLPSHSESVSWISGRCDVIAIALGLTALVLFLQLSQKRSILISAISIVLFIAALLTKESVIPLPFIWCSFFIYD
jgi:protein O-mannosyl-transferase